MKCLEKRIGGMLMLIMSLALCNCNHSVAQTGESDQPKIEFGARKNPASGTADRLGTFKTVFADVAEKVVPSVVSVIPTKIDTVVFYNNPFYHFFDSPFNDDPFGFFFGQPHSRQRRPEPQVKKQERRQQGLGSGVIVSSRGHILTNYHVVSGADEIEVKLNDGRVYEADIVGSDSLSDVSVLKLKVDVEDLPVAYLGNSDNLRPGDWVIAVGNPFSLTSTVTTGIVSALGRNVSGGDAYQNFIQTDAAINPGNSGGALVNIDGELIGINTMIYTRSGGYMGIGFAIPINMAQRIMEDLIYHGKVERGWIGVTVQDIDSDLQEALDLKGRGGVLVGDVYKDEPAHKAGMKRGDVILRVNGKEVGTANQLRNVVASIRPGKQVPVTILRDEREVTLKMKIAKRDGEKIGELAGSDLSGIPEKEKKSLQKKLGITVSNLTSRMRQQYSIDRKVNGVVVTGIDRKYQDARISLREGDVITDIKVSGSAMASVRDVKEFEKVTRKIKKGDSVLFSVNRSGRSFFAAFKIR
ncbi:MAG: DegQ family serine endoprotease [Fibrobacterota bacterium]